MNRDEMERRLATATEQRRQALARLESAEARAEKLTQEQTSARDEVDAAHRAVAEVSDQVDALERAVAERRVADAHDEVAAAVRLRDDAAAEAATAVETALTLLHRLEEHRGAVEAALQALRALTRTPAPTPPPEPSVLAGPLQRLEDFVRARSDQVLMDDAVTAAATSPRSHAILDLPAHLQELARQRRERFIRQSRTPQPQAAPPPGEEPTEVSRSPN